MRIRGGVKILTIILAGLFLISLRPGVGQAGGKEQMILLEHNGCQAKNVIFVHGKDGNINQWDYNVIPYESDYNFWAFDYDDSITRMLPLPQLGRILNDRILSLIRSGQMDISSGLVLVGHSLGGLVVRAAIIDAQDNGWVIPESSSPCSIFPRNISLTGQPLHKYTKVVQVAPMIGGDESATGVMPGLVPFPFVRNMNSQGRIQRWLYGKTADNDFFTGSDKFTYGLLRNDIIQHYRDPIAPVAWKDYDWNLWDYVGYKEDSDKDDFDYDGDGYKPDGSPYLGGRSTDINPHVDILNHSSVHIAACGGVREYNTFTYPAPGKTSTLGVNFWNTTNSIRTPFTITLASADPYVIVSPTNNPIYVNELNYLNFVNNYNTPFFYTVSTDAPVGYQAQMGYLIEGESMRDYFPFQIKIGSTPPASPKLGPFEIVSVEVLGGNGDGRLEPRETVNLKIKIKNIGNDTTPLSATLVSDYSKIQIVAGVSSFEAIKKDEEKTNLLPDFSITLAEDHPSINFAYLRLYLTDANGNKADLLFKIRLYDKLSLAWSYIEERAKKGFMPSNAGLSAHPVIVDLNNNGLGEVINYGGSGYVSAFNNDKSLLWETYLNPPHILTLDSNASDALSRYVVAADINGDQAPELIISSCLIDGPELRAYSPQGILLWNHQYSGGMPAAADVDNKGDGKQEIVVAKKDGTVTLFDYQGNILWQKEVGPAFTDLGSAPVIADLDGNGASEIILGDTCVLDKNGRQLWSNASSVFGSPSGAVADADQDGKLEIYAGNRAFSYSGTLLWINNQVPDALYSPVVADLGSDGKYEVLLVTTDNRILVLSADTGEIIWSFNYGDQLGITALPISVFDANEDLQPEILASCKTGTSGKIYILNGSGEIIGGGDTDFNINHTPLIAALNGPMQPAQAETKGMVGIIAGDASRQLVRLALGSQRRGIFFWPQYQRDAAHTGFYNAQRPVFELLLDYIEEEDKEGFRIEAGNKLEFKVAVQARLKNTLFFSADSLPEGASFTNNGDGTATFYWLPELGQVGNYALRLYVSDGVQVDSKELSIIVQSPKIRLSPIDDKQVYVGERLNFSLVASDADNDPVTFSSVNLPEGATLNPTTGEFYWTPAYGQAGTYNVSFSASDGTFTDSESVFITVVRVPVANSQSVTTTEDTAKPITLTATDADGVSLIYAIIANSSHGTLSGIAPNLTYTPAADYNGSDLFTFQANDGTVDSNTATVSITVTAVNDAPMLATIGVKSVNEGSALSFALSATDVDGDSLTYSASNLPTGATLNPATGEFYWTPTYEQAGKYNVTFSASDGILSDSESVPITVVNVIHVSNYALTIEASNGTVAKNPDSSSYAEGTVITLTATADTGYSFSSWSGDLTGTTNPATIAMDKEKIVTANFSLIPPTPAAPFNLTSTAQARGKIALVWTDNSSNETGFYVERSFNNKKFKVIARLRADVKTYTNSGCKNGVTYYYRVRAYNAAGNSAYSNTASAVGRK